MSNILEVPQQQAILALTAKGWSVRHIARTLGINRRTVKRYADAAPKCTTQVIAGSVPPDAPKCTTEVITGSRSLCGAFQEVIAPMLELGLSAQ
jgi:predicted transcriptional regulator